MGIGSGLVKEGILGARLASFERLASVANSGAAPQNVGQLATI